MALRIFRFVHLLVLATFIFHGSCYSQRGPYYRFMKDASLAPAVSSYDYIVIGGGTSGCALAATLSQNATVLVLERGGSPYEDPKATDMDSFTTTLLEITPGSWSQLFVSEDGVYNTRARVLGGGSVLNAGFYTRASEDYVREAEWDEEEVEAAYEWVERKVAFEPPVMTWQSAVRDGLVEAGVVPYNGFTYEHIYGTKIGGTIFDRSGHRHTAADLLEYADPMRLVVYLHASVHKILFTTTQDKPRPRANGVIFQDTNGVVHKAELADNSLNDIILSAGAIGSPQLLMLSGVGPVAHLLTRGIEPLVDQPMVGQGMGDNPMNALFIPSPLPVEVSLVQVVGITEFDSYIEAASGLSLSYGPTRKFFEGLLDLLNETNLNPTTFSTQSIEDKLGSMDSLLNVTTRAGVIMQKVSGPMSRGHLELRTTKPEDNPSVRFNYFQEPEDLRKCIQGLSTIIKVIQTTAFSKFRYPDMSVPKLLELMLSVPTNLRPRHVTAAFDLEQFCIDTVTTIWHYHGGCQVGKVVDKNYRVFGVDALRVIDGSTFLKSPGTNPQATVMMLGRYMGQMILRERAGSDKEEEP
ncbi:PREDICTED: protein HOTHEAD-like [Tarenaya hassleriana]|uniref:protein HOTHEAD-like n=1 Tax=Tarenaya hassleriana TaxID=28532 RepID=UPI00053C6162|nr:PREDICTED: protein HOTHEAD-like [Tarenaya hassleriana]